MTTDDPHDHHLATAVAASYKPGVTTAAVNDRVGAVITDFERDRDRLRHHLRIIGALATIALVTALAGVVLWVVFR